MSRESFEKKRRDEFLKKMEHLYDAKDGTEPELQEFLQRQHYTTKFAMKLFVLLKMEDTSVRKEILEKLNDLFSNK